MSGGLGTFVPWKRTSYMHRIEEMISTYATDETLKADMDTGLCLKIRVEGENNEKQRIPDNPPQHQSKACHDLSLIHI